MRLPGGVQLVDVTELVLATALGRPRARLLRLARAMPRSVEEILQHPTSWLRGSRTTIRTQATSTILPRSLPCGER